MRMMAHTVQLLRQDMYCPIKAEIRTVDTQSDLTILLYIVKIIIIIIMIIIIIIIIKLM